MHKLKPKCRGMVARATAILGVIALGSIVPAVAENQPGGGTQPGGTTQPGGLPEPRNTPQETQQTQQQQPQQAGGRSTEPDNTKRNTNQEVTAEDQGGSAQDRELTRKIRRELVKSNELSSMGKNIKVITVNGKVTIKGPVHSEKEKQQITALAEKAAGKGNITDQLETKKR